MLLFGFSWQNNGRFVIANGEKQRIAPKRHRCCETPIATVVRCNWYVTCHLLTIEFVSGRTYVGNMTDTYIRLVNCHLLSMTFSKFGHALKKVLVALTLEHSY